MDSSIKSATYHPVFVKSAEVNATNVKVDIGTLTAQSGEVDVAVVSSFTSLVQHGTGPVYLCQRGYSGLLSDRQSGT